MADRVDHLSRPPLIMPSQYKTPGKKGKTGGKKGKGGKGKKAQAVDLVTGKAAVEYFFDPSLLIADKDSDQAPFKAVEPDSEAFFNSRYLFMPTKIIKPLDQNASSTTNGQPYAGPTLVKTADGVLHKIGDSTKLLPLHADDYTGMADVLHLPSVTEASLLHALRTRYKRDDIYTAAGPILISINPYKKIVDDDGDSIYSEEQMLVYRTQSDFETKPPHLFAVADRAYTALMESVHSTSAAHVDDEDPVSLLEHHVPAGQMRNQSIIISGESGAGKTEATKIIMRYLARITRKTDKQSFIQSPDGKMIAALEDRVLSSNPLLETFGNAQTLRNDNSSRFGKFIHINFNTTSGSITGASISNYLLEKTRITRQVEGERNYHIFYQLLSSADAEMLADLGLDGGVSAFNYLCYGQAQTTDADAVAFAETILCLRSIGLSQDQQKSVFSMAAAVLHLGNVQFEEKGESEVAEITPASLPSLKKACDLLGMDEGKLSQAILTKMLVVNGKSIQKPQNVAMAEDKRDALAKMTYSCLFLWLVKCVNETLRTTAASSPTKYRGEDQVGYIGVLDIYGFECFDVNGYEQFLINYCNEKLQRHFNRHLFEVEQQIYVSEGVDWSYITFNDNRPCLELIEGGSGTVGILNTLDDAWGGMGSTSEKDSKFVAHLHKLFGPSGDSKSDDLDGSSRGGVTNFAESTGASGGHRNFATPKFGKDRQFIILHYAGEVRYTAEGFVEKNMDTLSNELRDLGDESKLELPSKVYACSSNGAPTTSSRSSIRGVSVGSQFRTSLQALVADLEQTQPHYIRCIKPNSTKSSGNFLSGEVLKQLRYSGMMEAIRIRREGYALREEHESFYHRFSVLLSTADLEEESEDTGIANLVKVLSKRLGVNDADWQIGHSKIFLRRELADKLERLAKLRVHVAARTLGRFGRYIVTRRLSALLVAWVRFRLVILKKYREQRAATKLTSAVRRFKQQQVYHGMRRGVIQLQSQQRRKLAVRYVRKIRDPFVDLSFRDCQALLQTETSRLEKAVIKKNFRLAAELETKIEAVRDAVERKRPLTREVLELKIADVQKELDDAIQRKAYAECDPLQAKLEELESKRSELPSIEDMKEAIRSIESEVALAAKNRDFAGAASGQARLEEARGSLADVLAAMGSHESAGEDVKRSAFGFESRAQLEQEIADLSTQIAKAISQKNFSQASSLQSLLDEREKLRPLFPSVREIEEQLASARAKLEEAIAKKDFGTAGKYDETVTELERKLETEKARTPNTSAPDISPSSSVVVVGGEEKNIECRADLEDAISVASEMVSKSVASKNFKRADSIQSDIDKMILLRKSFPSLNELQESLRNRKKEMNGAVAKKQFAKADELNLAIESLEKKIAIEKKRAPVASRPVVKSGDTMSVRSAPVGAKTAPSGSSVVSAPVRNVTSPAPVSSGKTVRKLRPAKPLTSTSTDSILSVAQMLAKKRGNASIIVDAEGRLEGIITDTDFCRRVASKHVDPAIEVSSVMTPNPTCVSMSSSAMDALTTMVENHFRHLPVVDDDGAVVGLLDISKCLTDAIAKLEHHDEKSISTTEDVLKQVAGAPHSEALQQLLGSLLAQSMGGRAVPTLRSLLHKKPSTVVKPDASVLDAAMVMSENRKAALVVDDNGRLVGIFGFKDCMTRVIAKGVPLDSTPVSAVMTLEPESISPEMTVLEALQTMADNKFLTLPVCESGGKVVGLVDVMDVIYGCGGTEGWRSVFSSAMDIEDDDVSDVTSVHSFASKAKAAAKDPEPGLQVVKEATDERPVSMLRPSKPIVVSEEDTILRTVKLLTTKRAAATLVVGSSGGLSGIVTDKDITCRVVAKDVDPSLAPTSAVMTPNPTCVSMTDSAMDALQMMVENRFRHLPVLDEHGAVTGTLDIAKCLSSVIVKLEKMDSKGSAVAEDMLKQVVSQQGAIGAQAAALQALLGNLMSQAMGTSTVPTLRSLLQGKPGTLVKPETSVREAGLLMAERRHAAVVVDESGHLVGIFGFKDMMTRAVAKELPLETTPVSEVMTPEPDFVSPEMTVLEALQCMADNKYLTLPVCETNGFVVGLVDVMDVIYGCGGAEGWRSIFSSAMELTDDQSSASGRSREPSIASGANNSTGSRQRRIKETTVSKLRPSKPHLSLSDETILSVAQLLQRKRGDASLVVNPEGSLAGILTDTDFTRRVVARDLDPTTTSVADVMTPDPTCVAMSDSAVEALTIMVENHFRHLPVVDAEGSVVGLLDIGKCLNDAIAKLERSGEKANTAAVDVVKQVATLQKGGANAAALAALLGDILSKAVGGKALPSLRSLLHNKPSTIVTPHTTVRAAATLMSENRKAALVVNEDGMLVGIFGFKDMMTRVIARELPVDLTLVSEVMTPEPEFVSPEINVLEALQTMYDHKFLTLPVCEEDGKVVGLVDALDTIYGCGGTEGWRSIFSNAMDLEDLDETASRSSAGSAVKQLVMPATPVASRLPGNIPATLEFEDDNTSFAASTIAEERRGLRMSSPDARDIIERGVFKVIDPSGNTHRIKTEYHIESFLDKVAERAGMSRRTLQLQYIDDEGDIVIMTSDDDVAEAWALARKAGHNIAKVTAVVGEAASFDPKLFAGGFAFASALAAVAFIALGNSKRG